MVNRRKKYENEANRRCQIEEKKTKRVLQKVANRRKKAKKRSTEGSKSKKKKTKMRLTERGESKKKNEKEVYTRWQIE